MRVAGMVAWQRKGDREGTCVSKRGEEGRGESGRSGWGGFRVAAEREGGVSETNKPDRETVALDEESGELVAPNGSVG